MVDMSPCDIARKMLEQVRAVVLVLIPDKPQIQQKNTKAVPHIIRMRYSRGAVFFCDRCVGDSQRQQYLCLDLASVERGIAGSDLIVTMLKKAVQVQSVVTSWIVVSIGAAVSFGIPQSLDSVHCSWLTAV